MRKKLTAHEALLLSPKRIEVYAKDEDLKGNVKYSYMTVGAIGITGTFYIIRSTEPLAVSLKSALDENYNWYKNYWAKEKK